VIGGDDAACKSARHDFRNVQVFEPYVCLSMHLEEAVLLLRVAPGRKQAMRKEEQRGDSKSQNYFIVSEPPTEVCVAANFSLTRKAELHTLLLLGGSDAKLLNQ